MTRKHFIAAALMIRNDSKATKAQRKYAAQLMAAFFERNARSFNRPRFLAACEVPSS